MVNYLKGVDYLLKGYDNLLSTLNPGVGFQIGIQIDIKLGHNEITGSALFFI